MPYLEKQTNYIVCLDHRGEKDDAINDHGKTKCVKRKFKAKDEWWETDNDF